MALDVINPTILNEEKTIGGFCLVEPAMIDNVNYFAVDASLIGVDISYINSFGNTLVTAIKLAEG